MTDTTPDAVVVGDSAEFGSPLTLKVIETPAEAVVLGDFPETTFQVGTFATSKTLMIAEFKLTAGTLFRAGKGIRHPDRFYRGTVISFGSIIRSIPVPSGVPQISDATVTLADTDGELRKLMSQDPPQNRKVVLKIGDEGASESVFQVAYSGVITHVTFPPGQARLFLRDISFQFMNELSPNLLTRDNFIADPFWAKNLLGRSEGRFEESEIFSPIVFGIVDSTGLDTPGAINAVRLDSTTFNLAQHPIPHGPIKLFKKELSDTTFTEITGGFSIVEVAKTIDGVDFIFTQAVFGSARSDNYELRFDGEGMTDDGTKDGTVIRNPIEVLRAYLIRIARKDPFEDLDAPEFTAQAQIVDAVITGGAAPGLLCDGAIAQRMTHREAITRILTSFNFFLFSNKDGKLTPRYIGDTDPNRPVLDDVQDIYRKTETHALARPIINDINLQYFRTYSDQSWNSQLTVDDPQEIDILGRRETKDLKLFFVRDDLVADKAARDYLQFTNSKSFRIVMTVPGHRRTQDIELGKLIGITSYSGPDPSGQGYENTEFLIHKTEFNTNNKQLKVHAVARVTPLERTRSQASEWAVLTSGVGSGTYGDYEELISSTDDLGTWVVVQIRGSQGVSLFELFDLAIGSVDQEVNFVDEMLYRLQVDGAGGSVQEDISFPFRIPSGSRISARSKDTDSLARLSEILVHVNG